MVIFPSAMLIYQRFMATKNQPNQRCVRHDLRRVPLNLWHGFGGRCSSKSWRQKQIQDAVDVFLIRVYSRIISGIASTCISYISYNYMLYDLYDLYASNWLHVDSFLMESFPLAFPGHRPCSTSAGTTLWRLTASARRSLWSEPQHPWFF